VTWRADTVADETLSPVIALGPSFAEWAAGLSEAGEQDDPDGDGLWNLLEYAFGGDPEDGLNQDANGDPLLPRLRPDGPMVELVFSEREDKVLRGLQYVVEFSTDLVGWTPTGPAGVTSATGPHSPAIPGFVQRTLRWPDDGALRFVRVGVLLDE